MRAEELKVLRLESGLTQGQAAVKIGTTVSSYQAYERGTKPVPDNIAFIATRRLGKGSERGDRDELVIALGEAVLLLDAGSREELLGRVRRDVVLKAVAEATMARVNGSLTEAIGSRDMRIRQLEAAR